MSQLGKLYKYYFRKIFRRNWLRITLITLVVVVGWWFVLPYTLYKINKGSILTELQEEKSQGWDTSKTENQVKQWTFRNWSKGLFGQETEVKVGDKTFKNSQEKTWKWNREKLTKKIKELEKAKKTGDLKKMEKLKKEINYREAIDRTLFNSKSESLPLSFDSPWKANTAFFFCQTEGYKSEKPFLKLLNDISWWNLTGTVALFWLFFNVLDNVFFEPQKNGGEATVLTTAPGVKRSDIIWGKIFAFLTFYFIANVLLFLFPFGFYYWWTGINTSVGWFSLLALWTIIIGPILFFGLIFIPYLFLKAKAKWAGWIASTLLAFFPIVWFGGKRIMPASWTWCYSAENWFFNPVWFIPISLITGIVFLALCLWHYENQDLN